MGGSWLDDRAARDPGRPAFRWQGADQGFAQLHAHACRRAAGLHRAGVRAGDRVAVLLPNGPDFVALFHAIDGLGATLLPLNLRLTASELAFQARDAAPRLLVHGKGDLGARAREVRSLAGTPTLACDELDDADVPLARPAPDPETPLALIYTSGTTGEPKGALLTRRALAASARASKAHLGVRPDDRWLACLPLFHVGGLALLARSVLDGTGLVLHERFDARAVSRELDRGEVSGISLVPTMLERVLDARHDRPAPDGLRVVLLGGAAAPASLVARAERAGFPVAPTYGLTEASSQVATRRPGAPVAAGLAPLPGVAVRVVDGAGGALPPDGIGEIEVRGPTLMTGYWRRPEDDERALRDGWLRTGDLGRLDAEGGLHVVERRADLIVSGGENVYPAEIERVLLQHPDVREVAVAGIDDARFGRRPAAWIVPERATIDAGALERHCRAVLAGYKVPVRFVAVPSLPRNVLGKLLRRSLPRPDPGVTTDAGCAGRGAERPD